MGRGFRPCEGTEGTEELSNQNQRAGTARRRVRRRAELSFLVSISFVWVIFLLTPGELWELRLTGLSNVLMCGPVPLFFLGTSHLLAVWLMGSTELLQREVR